MPHAIVPPQPSGQGPQLIPAGQAVIGVQRGPQTEGVPPPPQVSEPVQLVGQVQVLPHPLLTVPQRAVPPLVQAVVIGTGVHGGWPQTDGVPPPPHESVPVHAAQVHVPPHPLLAGPQRATPALVHAVACGIGTQVVVWPASIVIVPPSGSGMIDDEPQTFGSPAPPHASPAGHDPLPHVIVCPHPSATTPQFIGMPFESPHAALAVTGMQPSVPPH